LTRELAGRGWLRSGRVRDGELREAGIFAAEARWLRDRLDGFPAERLSPLLNLGSSDAEFRERRQPWIAAELFRPLAARGIEIVHVDRRAAAGVDIQADLTDPDDLARLRALRPKALLCCNLLEHVHAPERLARHCLELLDADGLVFVTVPFSYPYHADPIDTMYRPRPEELALLFAGARMREARILDVGLSYRDAVRARPWLLLRHLARLPLPFLSPVRWRRSMAKLYWLAAPYRISCAVLEK
jgi:SAM-dependent methyltransferase